MHTTLAMQDLDDGAYHEEDEQAEQFTLKVQDIVALEWATCHSLGLGSNDYTPACVMEVLTSPAGGTMHGTGLSWPAAQYSNPLVWFYYILKTEQKGLFVNVVGLG